jgi:prepilin-type processing-associated H-X9-DG protein/prepilin-type N-terminal cleavage/methylation domain-containing protein
LKPSPASRGFTLVEVLVVVAIIVAATSIAVPVARSLMTRSHAVNCSSNLRQIGLAAMMYAGDNQMTLPSTSHQRGGRSWTLTLQPYVSGTITFKCAQDPHKRRAYTYVINDFLTPYPAGADHLNYSILARIERTEATFMFAEASPSHSSDHFHFAPYAGGRIPSAVFEHQVAVRSHGESANYLFADGHVETLSRRDIQTRLATGGSRFVDPSSR